jgi:hypothetical protein
MILLISSSPKVEQCAPVLSRELGERVECVTTLSTAAAKLRDHACDLLVIDELFLQTQVAALEGIVAHAGDAIPLFFNPAITGTRRLVLEARAGLRRRESERRLALHNALCMLRNDLRSDVTGILLSSQLALDSQAAPAVLELNLKSVCSLAERLSHKLG